MRLQQVLYSFSIQIFGRKKISYKVIRNTDHCLEMIDFRYILCLQKCLLFESFLKTIIATKYESLMKTFF